VKFMLTFAIKPEIKGRDEAIARFKRTGADMPKGARLIGRWTAADFSGGFVLIESDDAAALTARYSCAPDCSGARLAGAASAQCRYRRRPGPQRVGSTDAQLCVLLSFDRRRYAGVRGPTGDHKGRPRVAPTDTELMQPLHFN
jgi:Protein of unknown function (DUF3303)